MRGRSVLFGSFGFAALVALLGLSTTNCGSTAALAVSGDDGGDGVGDAGDNDASIGSSDDATSGPTPLPVVCGSDTCRVGQYCMHDCCAQYRRTCAPAQGDGGSDGGCPPRFHSCQGDVPSCEEDVCESAGPPRCVDAKPASSGCNLQGSENIVLECHCN